MRENFSVQIGVQLREQDRLILMHTMANLTKPLIAAKVRFRIVSGGHILSKKSLRHLKTVKLMNSCVRAYPPQHTRLVVLGKLVWIICCSLEHRAVLVRRPSSLQTCRPVFVYIYFQRPKAKIPAAAGRAPANYYILNHFCHQARGDDGPQRLPPPTHYHRECRRLWVAVNHQRSPTEIRWGQIKKSRRYRERRCLQRSGQFVQSVCIT